MTMPSFDDSPSAIAEAAALQQANDDGYLQALDDVEQRIAEMSKTILWDSSDLRNPQTGEFWNPRAKAKYGYQMTRATELRRAAKVCERLRMDQFE